MIPNILHHLHRVFWYAFVSIFLIDIRQTKPRSKSKVPLQVATQTLARFFHQLVIKRKDSLTPAGSSNDTQPSAHRDLGLLRRVRRCRASNTPAGACHRGSRGAVGLLRARPHSRSRRRKYQGSWLLHMFVRRGPACS